MAVHYRLASQGIIQKEPKDMTHFKQYIQYKALDFKFSTAGTNGIDQLERLVASGSVGHAVDGQFVPAQAVEEVYPIPIRNVCAKLSADLVDRLDNALSVLSMSKRQFIEMALIEALDQVDKVLVEVDAFEHVEAQQEAGHE
jgi:predicted transcriptional regulator